MKYDVFISYRREGGSDKADALESKLQLKIKGCRVFLDTSRNRGGDWKKRINDSIRESCNFVVLISKGCFPHQGEGPDYYLDEIVLALRLGKVVIPVYYDGMEYDDIKEYLVGVEGFHDQNHIVFNNNNRDGSVDQIIKFLKTEDEVLKERYKSLSKERTTIRQELILLEGEKAECKCPVCASSYSEEMTYCHVCGYKFFDDLEESAAEKNEKIQERGRLKKHKEIWRNCRSDEIVTELKQQLEEMRGLTHKLELEHQQQEKKLKDQLQESETKRKELEGQCVDLEKQLETLKKKVNASVIGQDSLEIPVNDKVSFKMIRIEGGKFWMGAQKTDPNGKNYDKDAFDDESPVHSVRLNSFYISETLVTQALWKVVMGSEPTYNGGWESRYGKGVNHPAYRVSYNEIVEDFLPKLNQITGKNFRLPREAEWEYAAKGGKERKDCKYSGSDTIDDVAWYAINAGGTKAVKTKLPNELGIFDMSGNVWEWCSDAWYKYESAEEVNSKHDGQQDSLRVLRGGSWSDGAESSRVTCRAKRAPIIRYLSLGFRLVLPQ